MVAAILLARLLGSAGLLTTASWAVATRVGMAMMFLFTGSAHFAKTRADLIRMVPPSFPNPALLVTLTGVAEMAGAVGLLVPTLARWAAAGLMLLLVAMFPANIHAARGGVTIRGRAASPLVLRLPLQVLWLLLLWWSASAQSS
jgi:uncharacterized membrane protein